MDRSLNVRVPQVDTFKGPVCKVAAHSLDDSPNTAPWAWHAACKSEEVRESLRVLGRDGQVRDIGDRTPTLSYLLLEHGALALGIRQE